MRKGPSANVGSLDNILEFLFCLLARGREYIAHAATAWAALP